MYLLKVQLTFTYSTATPTLTYPSNDVSCMEVNIMPLKSKHRNPLYQALKSESGPTREGEERGCLRTKGESGESVSDVATPVWAAPPTGPKNRTPKGLPTKVKPIKIL